MRAEHRGAILRYTMDWSFPHTAVTVVIHNIEGVIAVAKLANCSLPGRGWRVGGDDVSG